jgi:DNA-binding MarR family transcriptional regulator
VADGNLSTHLATLEKTGYIAIKKDFVGKRTRTRAAITRAGRRVFEAHLLFLRDIIAGEIPDEE